MIRSIISAIALMLSMNAIAITDDLILIGKGSMSWLFLDLYDASLYSVEPIYNETQYPKALSLTYKRDISNEDLVKSTRSEWQRLKLNIPSEVDSQLMSIWPNVKHNDTLTFRANSPDSGSFYLNGQHIGDLKGDALAHDFLAIWLSSDTREQKLRAKLIGKNNV